MVVANVPGKSATSGSENLIEIRFSLVSDLNEVVGMHFIVSTNTQKVNPETRLLIRSHVMRGKNRDKSAQVKRRLERSAIVNVVEQNSRSRAGASSTVMIRGHSLLVPKCDRSAGSASNTVTAATQSSIIPVRVGTELSFTSFAIEMHPALFEKIGKCKFSPCQSTLGFGS